MELRSAATEVIAPARPRILLSGATGYVGGELLAALQARGLAVRCLARRPEVLRARLSARDELFEGDLLRPETLGAALEGIETAYYLVHSLGAAKGFEEKEQACAAAFADAAKRAGLSRVVYLGGLGADEGELSPHLASRHEVGRILRERGVPTLELRASIVLGPGSLSFEMLRALVERLPLMITPRWVEQEAQPIAIEDLVRALLAALELPLPESRVIELGGADRASYGDLMREYARQRGLARGMLRVPVLTPRLSGLWLGLVAPLEARVGRRLVESIRHPTVVRDPSGMRALGLAPLGYREAIEHALERERARVRDGSWYASLGSSLAAGAGRLAGRVGGLVHDTRWTTVAARPAEAFAPVRRIGGRGGWHGTDALWALRGWIDRAFGGPGMGRGRRDPEELLVGEELDCWRVERLEGERRLLLAARMRLPGSAWLEFTVEPSADGARLRQSAVFLPRGLCGLAYWFAVLPLHGLVFRALLRGLARAAEAEAERAAREARLRSGEASAASVSSARAGRKPRSA